MNIIFRGCSFNWDVSALLISASTLPHGQGLNVSRACPWQAAPGWDKRLPAIAHQREGISIGVPKSCTWAGRINGNREQGKRSR
ncbi:MAG TPA: hypothetical protein VGF67_18325 [Ktedonobacteraceae bacterium]